MPRKHRRRSAIGAASIVRDVHCVECGYNLRTLRRADVCPECRTPIKRSLAGPLLRNAGTAWLTRVHHGLWLLHRASVLAAFAIIGFPVVNIYLSVYGNMPGSSLTQQAIPLTMMTWAVLAAAGLWLASTPTPRDDTRPALQSVVERLALFAIPLNTIAWIVLGLSTLPGVVRLFGNPLAMLGVPAPGPISGRAMLIALAAITWAQSMHLARWLNRIDARVDPAVRRQPTLFDRVNWSLTRSHDNPPGASAEFARGLAKWSPAALAGLMILAAIGQKSFPWWVFALMASLPLMILLSMRRTVRDVGEERAINMRKAAAATR